tara:strand:- start:1928 stop:2671 length:744 start_codon:yes stop_codon:yes gene_type:complete
MLNIKDAKVKSFDTIDSTNSEAHRILNNNNLKEPLWILTSSQTSGRGRNSNSWISEKGNLFVSLVIPIVWNIRILPMLSCVIALSVYETISQFVNDTKLLKIKWPNDILFDDAKISGILIENQISELNKYSVIGIGVNINTSPDKLDYKTQNLKAISSKTDFEIYDFFISLKECLHKNLNIFGEDSLDYFNNTVLKNAWRIGENIIFKEGINQREAKFVGFTKNYEIVLEIEGEVLNLSSGEISITR